MPKLTAARNEILRALEDPKITPRTAVALRAALRLIDTVAEHQSASLHEEALRVVRDALETAGVAGQRDI